MIDLDCGAVPKSNWQTKSGWAAFVGEQLRDPAPMSRRELDVETTDKIGERLVPFVPERSSVHRLVDATFAGPKASI